MAQILSDIMRSALDCAREHGKLERWDQWTWTYAGCPARMVDGMLTPDQIFTWMTIRGLLDRELLRVSRSSKPDGAGYVVEVEIVK